MRRVANERNRASFPLWGALIISGGAWTVSLIAGQFLVESLCGQVASDPGAGARAAVWIPLAILTAVAVFAAIGAGFYALSSRGALRRTSPGLDRAAPLSLVVALLAFFFAGLIVLERLPLLFIGCGGA